MYIYDLPYDVRKDLCRTLDSNGKWEELGGKYMGFDYTHLQVIRQRRDSPSPTDEVLTEWGNKNHTVNELFILLSKMQHYRAMRTIIDFVDKELQTLFKRGEELMNRPQGSVNILEHCNTNLACNRQVGSTPSNIARQHSSTSGHSIEDNRDQGLAQQKMESKEIDKTTNQYKIQNTKPEQETQLLDQNSNAQGHAANGRAKKKKTDNPSEPQITVDQSQRQNNRRVSRASAASTPFIEFEELNIATNGWDESCILGKGGFGTVYKGTWKNTCVAIKKLEPQKDQPVQTNEVNSTQMVQLERELMSLNCHRHDNILPLYGYCIQNNIACLVYQYMANGSLEDRLHDKKNGSLSWVQRLNIMTGTARGIQFLHSAYKIPLVHGDIKSANILLDRSFEPRLGDFGLAREGPIQEYTHIIVSRVHGTKPYLPEEFFRGREFSVEVDTYSFGVVLFEVATGLRAYDKRRKEPFLKDHVVSHTSELSLLADFRAGQDKCQSAAGLLTLGLSCVVSRKKRPKMDIVLNGLNTLYNNYRDAERATYELRNQSLLLPLQLSPQPVSLPFQYQGITGATLPLLQALPQHFQHNGICGMGTVQVLAENQTGLPQPIIIHHPPPTWTVQPPTISQMAPHQATFLKSDNSYCPLPLVSSEIPLLTELGIPKTDSPRQQPLPSSTQLHSTSRIASTQDSISIESRSTTHLQEPPGTATVNTTDDKRPEWCSHDGAYLPIIPDLQSLRVSDN